MPMKLYIDDLRPCPEGWTLARTVTEAIRILATQDVTEVSIDHDISHAIALNLSPDRSLKGIVRPYPCGETFEPVAYFLREKYGKLTIPERPKITIHSANAIGANRIQQILHSAGLECTIELGKPVNGLEI